LGSLELRLKIGWKLGEGFDKLILRCMPGDPCSHQGRAVNRLIPYSEVCGLFMLNYGFECTSVNDRIIYVHILSRRNIYKTE